MLSHVFVGVADLERAFTFYTAVAEALNLPLNFCERCGEAPTRRRSALSLPPKHP